VSEFLLSETEASKKMGLLLEAGFQWFSGKCIVSLDLVHGMWSRMYSAVDHVCLVFWQ